jgi:peptidoglycan-N-acetylglucosamine deacetylase
MRSKGIKKLIKGIISPALVHYSGPTANKTVALTFDDGPEAGITDEIVRTLARRGHRATFFVIGQKAELHPSLVRSIVSSGCEVGNHSYSHARVSSGTYVQIAEEVERCDRVLTNTVGGASWFRPPGGRLSWRLLLYLRRSGRTSPVLWSVCIPQEHRKSKSEILETLRSAAPIAGDIILLHDDHPNIPEALPSILDLLDERGLRSVPVGELLTYSDRPIRAKLEAA